MALAVVSANLGSFDIQGDPVPQSVPCTFTRITDREFPPRSSSLSPRLQARIVKLFMWQFVKADVYLWCDSSCTLSHPDSVKWFVDQLGTSDIAVFRHPNRKTVQEEADYLKHRLAIKCPYITPRYRGEDIDGQLSVVNPSAPLYASTAFIYQFSPRIQVAMKEWWHHCSRFHSIDQLSFPWALEYAGCRVRVIEESYLKTKYLTYLR